MKNSFFSLTRYSKIDRQNWKTGQWNFIFARNGQLTLKNGHLMDKL